MSTHGSATSTARRPTISGAASIFLLATSIAGCVATPPRPEPEVRTVIVRPSASLLLPTPDPGLSPALMSDYVDYSYACEAALAKCNADKAGIKREVE
jgi:hypothetical protein